MAEPQPEQKVRVLIVDDDEQVRAGHQRLLERAGYEVRTSSSPFEGLELARDWSPDVVLLDLVMPTVSGFEAVKVFKRKPGTRDAVLIAFSGMIADDEVERFRRIGFDEILPKPVRAEDLAARIGGFLARRRMRT